MPEEDLEHSDQPKLKKERILCLAAIALLVLSNIFSIKIVRESRKAYKNQRTYFENKLNEEKKYLSNELETVKRQLSEKEASYLIVSKRLSQFEEKERESKEVRDPQLKNLLIDLFSKSPESSYVFSSYPECDWERKVTLWWFYKDTVIEGRTGFSVGQNKTTECPYDIGAGAPTESASVFFAKNGDVWQLIRSTEQLCDSLEDAPTCLLQSTIKTLECIPEGAPERGWLGQCPP